jgi:hypothetical protein
MAVVCYIHNPYNDPNVQPLHNGACLTSGGVLLLVFLANPRSGIRGAFRLGWKP